MALAQYEKKALLEGAGAVAVCQLIAWWYLSNEWTVTAIFFAVLGVLLLCSAAGRAFHYRKHSSK